MKPGSSNPKQQQRPRSRIGASGTGGGGPSKKHVPVRNQTFDSSGPDGRIRGNAHQVLEKYLQLARDASSQGDRIAAENYYQHAEHYYRVINAANERRNVENARRFETMGVGEEQPVILGLEPQNSSQTAPEGETLVQSGDESLSA